MKRDFRKLTFDKYIILVSCMVDLHNIGNYNADTGFKTCYLLELEMMIALKNPIVILKKKLISNLGLIP